MDRIALLPLFITFLYLLYKPPEKAFIRIYLPCLVLFPMFTSVKFMGLPDFNFAQSAMMPILVALVFRTFFHQRGGTKHLLSFGFLDFLVVTFVAVIVYSEYYNTGHRRDLFEGRLWVSLCYKLLVLNLIPYYLARELIYPKGKSDEFAKMFVVLLSIIAIVSVLEWRLVINVFDRFAGMFFKERSADRPWLPTFRLGFTRISGSFYHPILLGTAFGCGLVLSYWSNRKQRHRLMGRFDLFFFILLAGIAMTISRGPWLSFFLGMMFVGVGDAHNRKLSMLFRLSVLFLVLVMSFELYEYYKTVNTDFVKNTLTGSAVYRTRLIKEYLGYVDMKPWLGWGSLTYPAAGRFGSIDNHFLWITVKHGYLTLFLFVLILVVALFRLFIRGMTLHRTYKVEISLCFALFASLIVFSSSIVTVYLGNQLEPLLFILLGWTEGFLRETKGMTRPPLQQIPEPAQC